MAADERRVTGSPLRPASIDERLRDMPDELNEAGRERERSDYIKEITQRQWRLTSGGWSMAAS